MSGGLLPPQNLEAERAALGAMLLNRQAVAIGIESLRATDFYRPEHAKVFAAISVLARKGNPVDLVTVVDELRRLKVLKDVGGEGSVAAICDSVASVANAEYYCRIVAEMSGLRECIEAGEEIQRMAYDTTRPARDIIARAHERIYKLYRLREKSGWQQLAEGLGKFFAKLDSTHTPGTPMVGLPTGIKYLDQLTTGLQPGDLNILAGRPSQGKAQPLDALVLTPTGFRTMGSLEVGDQIMGADGKAHHVVAVHPRGQLPVYRVTFQDRGATECCGEHLWLTRDGYDRTDKKPGRVRSTLEIMRKVRRRDGGNGNHQIPHSPRIEFAEACLPMSPYLLGLVIGDGTMKRNICIEKPERDVLERAAANLPECDVLVYTRGGGRIKRRVRSKHTSATRAAIVALGLAGLKSPERFIPQAYLLASYEQRLALLRGLLDTDGSVHMEGTGVEYSTTSPRLAKDIQFLVGSLGGRYAVQAKTTSYQGACGPRPYWRINIVFLDGTVPVSSDKHLKRWHGRRRVRHGRPIRSIEPVGIKECRCITTSAPDGLYITNDFAVTHNSSLALNIIGNVSIEPAGPRLPSAIFSLEMGYGSLVDRLCYAHARVNAHKGRSGHLSRTEIAHLTQACEAVHGARVYIDDVGDMNILELQAKARKLKMQVPDLALIVVDYLQLISGVGGEENRVREVTKIGKGLKSLAKEMGIPVLALSQLSRATETRAGGRPQLSDLRESGSLEQDADTVMFIYRPAYYVKRATAEDKNKTELILGKQRNGPTGLVPLVFVGEYARFEPRAGDTVGEEYNGNGTGSGTSEFDFE